MRNRYFGQTPAQTPQTADGGRYVDPQSGKLVDPQAGRIVEAPNAAPGKASWQANPLQEMMDSYRNLKVKNARLEAGLYERARALENQENQIAADSLRAAFPAGVADLDRIISPFFYPFLGVEVAPNRTEKVNIIISNEAPFEFMGLIRTVFRMDQGAPIAIDPEERNPALPNRAPGLSFMIEDEGSTKTFMKTPIPIDLVGAPHFPFTLPVGHLFLAKSSVSVTYTNEHPTITYIPFIMLVGAKLYIDPRGNLGSLVSAK